MPINKSNQSLKVTLQPYAIDGEKNPFNFYEFGNLQSFKKPR